MNPVALNIFFFLGYLLANDFSGSRTARLRKTLQSYLPRDFLEEDKIQISSIDGCKLGPTEEKRFDRVRIEKIIHKKEKYGVVVGLHMGIIFICFFSTGPCRCSLHHGQTHCNGGRQQYV